MLCELDNPLILINDGKLSNFNRWTSYIWRSWLKIRKY
jgi:hypothetical protein